MKSIKESVNKILEYFDNNEISIDVFQEDENESFVFDFPREIEHYEISDEELIEFVTCQLIRLNLFLNR